MKHVHRFFVDEALTAGVPVRLEGDDGFHAVRVLRLKAGDAVELADAKGLVFPARVTESELRGQQAAFEAVPGNLAEGKAASPVDAHGLTVVQALPAGRKMDLIVEKLSEIGVGRLVPVFTEKSVVREAHARSEKAARWRRVAKAAAAQSKRSAVMGIDEPLRLPQWLEAFSGEALVLSTETEGAPLGKALSEMFGDGRAAGKVRPLALIAGPEAGFSAGEMAMMEKHGVRFISLGHLVLRTETAALVAATVVMHRLGVIG